MNILTKIELKVLKEDGYYTSFRINYQSENLRSTKVLSHPSTMKILTTPDIEIISSNEPEVKEKKGIFFLRGSNIEQDYKELICSKEFYNKIQTGVSMINDNKEFLY